MFCYAYVNVIVCHFDMALFMNLLGCKRKVMVNSKTFLLPLFTTVI